MHWLGKDFLLKATRPDGSTVTLIRIDHWNFNWQGTYDFVEPRRAARRGRGSTWSPTSTTRPTNPANPSSPPKDVRWGEQTTDEMCIGFLQLDPRRRAPQQPAPEAVRSRACGRGTC